MKVQKRHWKKAQESINALYCGTKGQPSIFSPDALQKDDVVGTNAKVHKARAKIVCGTIFTLGLNNLYMLVAGAHKLRDQEKTALLKRAAINFATEHCQTFGLEEGWFASKLMHDLGLADPPKKGNSKAAEIGYALFLASVDPDDLKNVVKGKA